MSDSLKEGLEQVDARQISDINTLTFDLPLIMRLFELCRETIKDDIHLHTLTAALIDKQTQKDVLTMDDYAEILEAADIQTEQGEH